jgi:hypothetical protein
MRAPRVVAWIDIILVPASIRLPFHSCNYGVFICRSLIVRGLPAFTYAVGVIAVCHGDAAPVVETR